MPEHQVYRIHPLGWEDDPEEERYKISTLDYIATCVYNNYALYFKLKDANQSKVVEGLRHGLERTLSQTRHLCGTLEKDPDGDHSFVRRRGDTVELQVQLLDAPGEADTYPSFQDMEKSHFSALTLGDLDVWRIPHMRYGQDNASAHPDALPAVMGLRASLVRGGMLLVIHQHHYANDLSGWAGFVHQLADNCRAFLTGTPYPSWDPACLNVSGLTKPPVPEDQKIDLPGRLFFDPSAPLPLPGGRQVLLFHLPRSKAAHLKSLAQPAPPSSTSHTAPERSNNNNNNTATPTPRPGIISTYDATVAVIWRILTRLRHPHYTAAAIPLSTRPFWTEIIDMRPRIGGGGSGSSSRPGPSPAAGPFPARMQRNLVSGAVSAAPPPGAPPGPTVADLVSYHRHDSLPLGSGDGDRDRDRVRDGGGDREREGASGSGFGAEGCWSLGRLAAWVRAMTAAAGTRAALDGLLEMVRVVRDKTRAAADLHRLPALALVVTDHRGAGSILGASAGAGAVVGTSGDGEGVGGNSDGHGADFGFGAPVAYRQLWGRADVGMVIVYPPRVGDREDEGFEFTVGFEKVLAEELVEDEEWARWFEFRGVDWEEDSGGIASQ